MKNKEKFTTYTYTDVYEYVDERTDEYGNKINEVPLTFPILENKMCSSSAWKKYSDLDADDPSTGIAKCKEYADNKKSDLTYVSYDEGSNKYKCYKSNECNYDKYAKNYTTYDVSALYDKSSKHKLADQTHIYTDYYGNEFNVDILYNKKCSFEEWKKFDDSSVNNLNEAIDKCLSYGDQLTYVSYDDGNNKYKCYKTDECNYDEYAKNFTTYDVSNIINEKEIIKENEDIEEEKQDYTDLVNSWTNDLNDMTVRDYNDKQCTNVLNSCIHTHYDTRLFNKKNINKLLDFLKIILYILVVCLISYYILSLNLDFKVKLIKLILFIVILVSLKIYHYNFIFSIIVILLLLLFKIFNVYKFIIKENNNKSKNKRGKITLSEFINEFIDEKYDVIRFPPKIFFKNITKEKKEEEDSNFIKDVFTKWDNFNFFQYYYHNKGYITNVKEK